jgi:SAM-dependent methyltransferase
MSGNGGELQPLGPLTDFRGGLYQGYVSTFKGQRPRAAEAAFAWWDHKLLPLLAGLDRGAAVLDLGCGAGELLAFLQQRGFSDATGVDISAEQVALATRRGVNATRGDVFQTLGDQARPGRARTYAAILAIDVFEHFSRDELTRLVPLLYRALAPGGRLLIQTANGAGLLPGQVIYGDLTHMTIFTPQSLGQLLRPAGFTNLTFAETGPVPIRLRGKLDTLLWQTITAIASTVRHIETGKRQAIWTENFLCLAFKP